MIPGLARQRLITLKTAFETTAKNAKTTKAVNSARLQAT